MWERRSFAGTESEPTLEAGGRPAAGPAAHRGLPRVSESLAVLGTVRSCSRPEGWLFTQLTVHTEVCLRRPLLLQHCLMSQRGRHDVHNAVRIVCSCGSQQPVSLPGSPCRCDLDRIFVNVTQLQFPHLPPQKKYACYGYVL